MSNNEQSAQPFENNSGQGENVPVLDIVSKRFNWGVVFSPLIWGFIHKKYSIIFIILLPMASIFFANLNYTVLPIVILIIFLLLLAWFGTQGNKWAWQSTSYKNIDEFHKVQKQWATAGVVLKCLIIVYFLLLHIAFLYSSPGHQNTHITGVNKSFATLNQAISLASTENNVSPADSTIGTSTSELIERVFVPLMKISQKWDKCFQTQDAFVYCFVPSTPGCGDIPTNPNDVGDNACFIVTVDVNGWAKEPNEITINPYKDKHKDQFVLYVYKNGVAGDSEVTGPILRGDVKNKKARGGIATQKTPISPKPNRDKTMCETCGTLDK